MTDVAVHVVNGECLARAGPQGAEPPVQRGDQAIQFAQEVVGELLPLVCEEPPKVRRLQRIRSMCRSGPLRLDSHGGNSTTFSDDCRGSEEWVWGVADSNTPILPATPTRNAEPAPTRGLPNIGSSESIPGDPPCSYRSGIAKAS
jgi:hypothetical protein